MKKKTTKKKIKKDKFTLWCHNSQYGIDAETIDELLELAMNSSEFEDGKLYYSLMLDGFLIKTIIVDNGKMSWVNHV